MEKVSPEYDKQTVRSRLSNVMYGALSTFSKGQINSRFMLFACDDSLDRIFMMTETETSKIAELKENSEATLTVLEQTERPEDTAEITIKGKATLVTEFSHEDVTLGLEKLGEKSPMVGALQAAGSLGDYSMIVIRPSEIVFRIYADILRHVPATIIR